MFRSAEHRTNTWAREYEVLASVAGRYERRDRAVGLRDEEIARLAYAHWVEGGRRDGTADEDWRWAEREWARLRALADLRPAHPETVLRAA